MTDTRVRAAAEAAVRKWCEQRGLHWTGLVDYLAVEVADAVAQAVKERDGENASCMEAEHGGHPTCPHTEELIREQAEEIALHRTRVDEVSRMLAAAEQEIALAHAERVSLVQKIECLHVLSNARGEEIARLRAPHFNEAFRRVVIPLEEHERLLKAAVAAERERVERALEEAFFTGLGLCTLCKRDWHDHAETCAVLALRALGRTSTPSAAAQEPHQQEQQQAPDDGGRGV